MSKVSLRLKLLALLVVLCVSVISCIRTFLIQQQLPPEAIMTMLPGFESIPTTTKQLAAMNRSDEYEGGLGEESLSPRTSRNETRSDNTPTVMSASGSQPKPLTASCSVTPNLTIALTCLHKTVPTMTLAYPSDAHQHFLEIHDNLADDWINMFPPLCAPRGPGAFCGPWLENVWIQYFSHLLNSTRANQSCLSDTFGPFIPLLIPFNDIWFQAGSRPNYPKRFRTALASLLRPNVPYITLSTNAQGLSINHSFPVQFDNILTLSSGGVGHVPIPLIKQEEELRMNKPTKRKWLLSYVGSLENGPIRKYMHRFLAQHAKGSYNYYNGEFKEGKWRNIMLDSYTSLVPRGTGRTAYHLMETIQMGLIPIYLYDDLPWLPYGKLLVRELGYGRHVDEFPALLDELKNTSVDEFMKQEERIASYRESHFSRAGIMKQIELFLQGKGDLECVRKPSSS